MSIIGLRFFTVYGPWGRPDMAYFKFTKAAYEDKPINIYNHGEMERDFTYIDDISNGIILAAEYNLNKQDLCTHEIFNLGNSSPEKISSLLKAIEINTGKTLQKDYLDMQPGDVKKTYADISKSQEAFNFKPTVNLEIGIAKFVSWYKEFYSMN
jgi:UDP-glucuronate 4-epimerase